MRERLTKALPLVLLVLFGLALCTAALAPAAQEDPVFTVTIEPTDENGEIIVGEPLIEGKSIEEWHREAERMRRLAYLRLRRNAHLTNQLRRTYWYPQTLEAACVTVTGKRSHPSCSRADAIIRCESVGSRYRVPNQYADNPTSTANGYGQFLDTTWATTVYGRVGVSVFNGVANVLAVVRWVHGGLAYAHWLASVGCWG